MRLFNSKKTPEQPNRRRPTGTGEDIQRNQAFSYYAGRSQRTDNLGRANDQQRAERVPLPAERKPLWKTKPLQIAGVAVLLIAAGYFSLLQDPPVIRTAATGGSAYFLQEPAAYEQTVVRTLNGSVFNKNKLTVDTRRIQSDLMRNYPEVAAVRVQKPVFGQGLIITVVPHKPSFILTTTDSKAFLLDSNGRALVSASQITDRGELAVPTLHDASGFSVELGSQALPKSIIEFSQSVTAILDKKNVAISGLTLPRSASELQVGIADRPYYVKFNLQEDVRQQSGTFLAAKTRLERDKITPATYIDVRVPERAYYK